jgi:hypothetical protein
MPPKPFMSLAGPVSLRQDPPRLAQLPGWNPGGSPAFIAQDQSTPVVVPSAATAASAAAPAPVTPPPVAPSGVPSLVLLGLGVGAFALATVLAFTCTGD